MLYNVYAEMSTASVRIADSTLLNDSYTYEFRLPILRICKHNLKCSS